MFAREAGARRISQTSLSKAASSIYGFMDDALWLSMLRERNNTAHIYDGGAALKLVATVIASYIPEFGRLQEGLVSCYGEKSLMGPEE